MYKFSSSLIHVGTGFNKSRELSVHIFRFTPTVETSQLVKYNHSHLCPEQLSSNIFHTS